MMLLLFTCGVLCVFFAFAVLMTRAKSMLSHNAIAVAVRYRWMQLAFATKFDTAVCLHVLSYVHVFRSCDKGGGDNCNAFVIFLLK